MNFRAGVLVLCLFGLLISPPPVAMGRACSVNEDGPPEAIDEILLHPALRGVDRALLRVTLIRLEVLQCSALRVTVLDRVPAREWVLVRSGGEWVLVLSDKKLVDGWQTEASKCLQGMQESPCSLGADRLARDITAVLVDPVDQFGVVLCSRESIPTDYQSSDVGRDFKRSGASSSQAKIMLLARAPREIGPPQLFSSEETAYLEFFSWNYFGGEIVSWRVDLKPMVGIHRDVRATSTRMLETSH